jgi:hypothetical protein
VARRTAEGAEPRRQRSGTIERIARAFTVTLVARARLCRLTSIFPSILERNVSAERTVQFKHGLLTVRQETAIDFHGCVPTIPASTFENAVRQPGAA